MNKIINGVASEYDMPMKYENKKTTIFIDTQDMEEKYGEGLYMDYLKEENQQLKQENDFLRKRENKLQTIEQMFKSGTVDLEELQKIIEGKK